MAGEQETAEALLAGLDPDAPVGIAALDRDGTYVEASASIAALIGVTRETLLGRSVDDFLSPEIAARVRATVAGVLERGRPGSGAS
jgi:PAS domain S-box-containing protein